MRTHSIDINVLVVGETITVKGLVAEKNSVGHAINARPGNLPVTPSGRSER